MHTGLRVPDEDGEWRVCVTGLGRCVLAVDEDDRLLEETEDPGGEPATSTRCSRRRRRHFDDGPAEFSRTAVDVRIRFAGPAQGFIFRVGLVVGPPTRSADEELAHAVGAQQ